MDELDNIKYDVKFHFPNNSVLIPRVTKVQVEVWVTFLRHQRTFSVDSEFSELVINPAMVTFVEIIPTMGRV